MAETMQTLEDLSSLKTAAPAEAPKYVQKIDKQGRAYATGKRKDAVARVWVKPGAGKITVNDRTIEIYFARPVLRMLINQPLLTASRNGQYDVVCTVSGGGLSGQAGAVASGYRGMRIEALAIPDVLLVVAKRFPDSRGYLGETFHAGRFAVAGIAGPFVQENQSYSRARGTIRGLHFQAPPSAQGKLVRCVRGAIFDVAVDIRRGSPTYGKHVSAVLTSDEGEQLWVPIGFAHGFCTLEGDCEVAYKLTAYYDPASERGLAFDDGDLNIPWPVAVTDAVVSDKDRRNEAFTKLGDYFAAKV